MKIFYNLLVFLLFINCNLYCKTYALIIGISNYQDKNIKDLNYADDDALAFRNFLLSEAGGSVDSNNIYLLLNEQAKVGDIYAAKRMLELKVKKNDLVYFYFSGHGGVESDIYKSGFLLAHDTPINNFQNNSVEILHINKMANTFSAQTKANVILITDACRSGSLSGIDDIGKKVLLQDQLTDANKREIRMASCLHNQLSQENKVWGGGRGLFSYELLNGLQGGADQNNDLKVTLKELQSYLNLTMEKEIDRFLLDLQTPVFDGEEKTILANIIPGFKPNFTNADDTLNKSEGSTKSVVSIVISTNDHFFNLLEENYFDGTKPYLQYLDIPINDFIDSIFTKKLYLKENAALDNELTEKFSIIENNIKKDAEAHFAFKQKLAATIHNSIQSVLNSYISVEKAELERRQFYNSNGQVFKNYAYMIDIALNAVSINSELYQILQMKKYYFQGLANRINFNNIENGDSLIDEAILFQEKAEKLNANTAYVQNELGILYECIFDTIRAEEKYLKAIKLVPEWALPYSNLSNLYYTLEKYELGKQMAQKALDLHPNLNLANFSLGRNSSKKGNYLLGKESYLKAIRTNPKHYVPYQYLGELYMQIAEFALADEYLKQAEILKKAPLNLSDSPTNTPAIKIETRATISMNEHIPQFQGSLVVILQEKETDILKLYYHGKINDQKESFEKIIELDAENFMAYKSLGDYYYNLEQYMEAQYLYEIAIQYHVDIDTFIAESLHIAERSNDTSLIYLDYYIDHYFGRLWLKEKLANLYRKRGFYDMAIQEYVNIIVGYPRIRSTYYRLWDLYEFLRNYQEAEKVIEAYRIIEPGQGVNELYAFYKRAIMDSNDPEYYNLAAGLLMFDLFNKENPDPYFFDNDVIKNEFNEQGLLPDFINGNSGIILAENHGETSLLALYHFNQIINIHIYFENYQIAAKLGRLYGFKGDYNLTKESFTIAAKNPKSSNYANSYLANLNSFHYDYTDAYLNLQSLRKSSQLDYSTSLKFIEYAILAGDYTIADSLIEAVKNLNFQPNNLILKQEALSNYLSGNFEKSIGLYQQLLNQDPTNPNLAFTIFRIFAQNQKFDKADPYLGMALNNGIMQFATMMRYDDYAFKAMFRFIKLGSGAFGSSISTKQ